MVFKIMKFLHLYSKHAKSPPLWWRLSPSKRRCARTAPDQRGASGSPRAWTLTEILPGPRPRHPGSKVSYTIHAAQQADSKSRERATQKTQVSLGAGRWPPGLQCSSINMERNLVSAAPTPTSRVLADAAAASTGTTSYEKRCVRGRSSLKELFLN